jgi:hypothetical protein
MTDYEPDDWYPGGIAEYKRLAAWHEKSEGEKVALREKDEQRLMFRKKVEAALVPLLEAYAAVDQSRYAITGEVVQATADLISNSKGDLFEVGELSIRFVADGDVKIACEGDKAVTLTAFGPFLSYEVIGALIEVLAEILSAFNKRADDT